MYKDIEFEELKEIIENGLNEELYIEKPNKNKDNFFIKKCYKKNDPIITDLSKGGCTEVSFRIEKDSLVIQNFYLSKKRTGTGSKMLKWFKEFCKKENISIIEIAIVENDNQAMLSFLDKFKFLIKDNFPNNNYILDLNYSPLSIETIEDKANKIATDINSQYVSQKELEMINSYYKLNLNKNEEYYKVVEKNAIIAVFNSSTGEILQK